MKKLIILGIGGSSIDILDAVNDINDQQGRPIYECVGFLDDAREAWGREHHCVKVLGPLDSAPNYTDCVFVNGIGNPRNFYRKQSIISTTQLPLDRFATIIHPSASVSRMSSLGFGTIVFQNVTIASNATIGNHVIILPNSVVSHDAMIGDYTCVGGGVCIAGRCEIGTACYVGANATVMENGKIGDNCLIGMGSVVIDVVPGNSVVVGNPARYLRKTIDEAK